MSRARSSGTYTPASGRGDCRSGKVQYSTRKQARQAAKHLPGERLGTYFCETCEWFHVGHMPQRVRSGLVDKDAWLDSKSRKRRRVRKSAAKFTPSDLARIVANKKQESA